MRTRSRRGRLRGRATRGTARQVHGRDQANVSGDAQQRVIEGGCVPEKVYKICVSFKCCASCDEI